MSCKLAMDFPLRRFGLTGFVKYDAFDDAIDDQIVVHETLKLCPEHDVLPDSAALQHQDQSIARDNGAAEFDAVQTAQTNGSRFRQLGFLCVIRAQLSCCLAH